MLIANIIALWKIYEKAGEPGWAVFVPFYSTYILYKISWGKGWYFLLTLIPGAGLLFFIITYIKLGRAFGKSGGFCVGLVFLPIVFQLILGFSKDTYYIGVPYKRKPNASEEQNLNYNEDVCFNNEDIDAVNDNLKSLHHAEHYGQISDYQENESTVLLSDYADSETSVLSNEPIKNYFLLNPTDGSLSRIYKSEFKIGRSVENNDLIINKQSVSHIHAIIKLIDGKTYINDQGSTNGTCIDGVCISPHMNILVEEGSILSFGGVVFQLLEE